MLGAPSLHLEQRDDFFLLVDVAGGQADRLVGDVLAGDQPGEHDDLAVALALRSISPGNSWLDLFGEPREVALHDDLVAADRAGAVPHEHRDRARRLAVDQQLVGDVTSASATSALVSETRAIGVPTSTTVERPTSSLHRIGRRSSAARPAAAAAGVGAATGACRSCDGNASDGADQTDD